MTDSTAAKRHDAVSSLTVQDQRLDEEELIGALITNCSLMDEVRHRVTPCQFYDSHLGQVFQVLLRLKSTTLQTVLEELDRRKLAPPMGRHWGEVLSICVDQAVGIKDADVSRRADAIRVRSTSRRRRELLLRMGRAGADGDDLEAAIGMFRCEIEEIDREDRQDGITAEFKQASQSYHELLTDETPEPEPLLGDLLYPASLATLVAVEGTGKGWVELQQIVSLAQGRPFFGLQTQETICGLVSLEDSRRILKERLPRVVLSTHADEGVLRDRLHFICPPRFNSLFDLLEVDHQRMLRDWIRDLELGFVAIDTMADAHSGDERDLRSLIQAVMPICRETGAVIQFAHHEPKAISTGRSRKEESLSHRSRGDTRFSAKTRFAMHLQRKGGLVLLSFSKTNEGMRPDPIWLKQEESGVFVISEAPRLPKEEAAERQTRMIDAISAAGADGLRVGELAKRLGVSTATIRRYGDQHQDRVEFAGRGRSRRLRMRTGDST